MKGQFRSPVSSAAVLIALMLSHLLGGCVGAVKGGSEKEAARRPWPRITISKKTTFITEPLRQDGHVDYVAALNQLASKDVTPENNAAVLFCQAFGPEGLDSRVRERFFKMLGTSPLPERGEYFVSPLDHFDRKLQSGGQGANSADQQSPIELAQRQIGEGIQRPWSEADFPILAGWLKENDKPVELILAGTRRPRHYVPRLCEPDTSSLPGALRTGISAARALCARAMFRLNAGRLKESHQDLLACHRLARLVAQGPTVFDARCGFEIEFMACRADAALAHYGNVTVGQAKEFAEEVRRLPPIAKLADKINFGARFVLLDEICTFARIGAGNGLSDRLTTLAGQVFIDWNEPLRMANVWFDRFGPVLSTPGCRERNGAFDELSKEFRNTERQAVPGESRSTAVGRRIGETMLGWSFVSLSVAAQAEDRATVQRRMTEVAFALAAYRAEHGGYPTDLAKLVPKCLKRIPEDPFSGKPLRYGREGTGYVLYSVGPNGQDDGGRESPANDLDTGGELPGDDIVIQIPVAK
jgi:hypothetical protein